MSRKGDEKQREQLGMEPTIPATEVKGVLPDFSSERSAPDNGGGGRSMPWVVGALVVGVAGVFWWMSPKSVPTAPSPATAVAPPVAPPTAKPAAKPAVKPAAAKPVAPVAVPPPVPAAPVPSAPDATPTSPSVVAAKPSAPPAHHKRPRHKKASAKAKPVKLPRLPSPPPAD